MDFSINTSECKVGQASALGPSMRSDEESMVVPSNQCARDKGREKTGLGEHPSNIPSSDAMCHQTRNESLGKKNVEGSAYCNQLHGQSVCREDHSSISANRNLQLACHGRGEEDGGIRALHNDDAWNRADNGPSEEDMMEFDGGGKASTSL